ncbi:MAG: thioredoxin fold domain-containing protein [Polaromonas sp.]|nr:thioredoxin fold domain-containing protein [Polaromonas sp.]
MKRRSAGQLHPPLRGPFNPQRRQAVLALVSGLLLPGAAAVAAAGLPASRSLADELRMALAAGKPLVVMASLDGCPYCQSVRQSHLLPLRASDGLAVVQINLSSRQPTRNFDGSAVTHDERLRAWSIRLAPTLLFIGRDGVEVAERLQGYSADFYSAYLAERLALAQKRIRG